MIFYSITSDGRYKYAADNPNIGFMRSWIENTRGPLVEALDMFDRSIQMLKNVPLKNRLAFTRQYVIALSQLVANVDPKNVDQVVADVGALRNVIVELGTVISNANARNEFYNMAGGAMGKIFEAGESRRINLRDVTKLQVPTAFEDGATGPAAEPTAAEQAMGGPRDNKRAPEYAPDVINEMKELAVKIITESSTKQIENEFNELPADIVGIIPLNAKEYRQLLDKFLDQLFRSIGDLKFKDYFERYGPGNGDPSTITGVTSDFMSIGRGFMYAILDAATRYVADQTDDETVKKRLFRLVSQFDKKEEGGWDSVGKQAEGILNPAKTLTTEIANDAFRSTSVQDKGKQRSEKQFTQHLYDKDGYEKLYNRFINMMKKLSPYTAWQSMLNNFLQPGTIEDGALDRLKVVWNQAKTEATDNPEAEQFLKNFAPGVNLPAINNIARTTLNNGDRAYQQDRDSEQFVEFLMQKIESASGVTFEKGVPEAPAPKSIGQPGVRPPPNLPIPVGAAGPGATAYAVGTVILAYYFGRSRLNEAEGERLKLNSPKETLNLNQPENEGKRIQINQPVAPAVSGGTVSGAPAVSGG